MPLHTKSAPSDSDSRCAPGSMSLYFSMRNGMEIFTSHLWGYGSLSFFRAAMRFSRYFEGSKSWKELRHVSSRTRQTTLSENDSVTSRKCHQFPGFLKFLLCLSRRLGLWTRKLFYRGYWLHVQTCFKVGSKNAWIWRDQIHKFEIKPDVARLLGLFGSFLRFLFCPGFGLLLLQAREYHRISISDRCGVFNEKKHTHNRDKLSNSGAKEHSWAS